MQKSIENIINNIGVSLKNASDKCEFIPGSKLFDRKQRKKKDLMKYNNDTGKSIKMPKNGDYHFHICSDFDCVICSKSKYNVSNLRRFFSRPNLNKNEPDAKKNLSKKKSSSLSSISDVCKNLNKKLDSPVIMKKNSFDYYSNIIVDELKENKNCKRKTLNYSKNDLVMVQSIESDEKQNGLKRGASNVQTLCPSLRGSNLPQIKESLSKKESDGEYKVNLKKQILDEINYLDKDFDAKFIKVNF